MTQTSFTFHETPTLDGIDPPKMTLAESNLHFKIETQEAGFPRGFGFYDDEDKRFPVRHSFSITIPIGGTPFVFVETDEYSKKYSDGVDMLNRFLRDYKSHPSYTAVKEWLKANIEELEHARRWYAVKKIEGSLQETEEKIKALQDKQQHLNRVKSMLIVQVREGRWLPDEERKAVLLNFGAPKEDPQ